MNLWERAAKQAMAELPHASTSKQEARAEEIMATLEATEDEVDQKNWRSPRVQHPAGQMVTDHRETGRRLMIDAGVNPDAPLNIDWDHVPDVRDNRDPVTVGAEIIAGGNGVTPKTEFRI